MPKHIGSTDPAYLATLPRDRLGKLNTADAKQILLEKLDEGWDVEPSARFVGRTRRGYEHWRQTDSVFRMEADIIFARRRNEVPEPCPDFPDFCRLYLNQPLFPHQLRQFDVIEGREPRDLHETMRYNRGNPQRIIINVPPEHGKSTTWSVNYVVWRLCRNPNYRVVLVSASLDMAKKFLHAVKQRLTHPTYAELQRRFGPPEGFKRAAESWTRTLLYLGGSDGTEKDPNVQAIGVGGQIYGARADEIIVDDGVVLGNVTHWDNQTDWITQEVITRLSGGPGSRLIVLGTRVAPVDLYQKLRDEFLDAEGNPVWTYFSQPAVLEYAESAGDWVTLWPEAFDTAGGVLVPKWDGKALKTRRDEVKGATWALVYQQMNVLQDAVFPEAAIRGAVQSMRRTGPLLPGHDNWNRPAGMIGLYVVAGLDPATTGYTAASVLGVDRRARRMWLLDQYNRKGILPRELRRLVKDWTVRYGVNEWRIESNAFQQSIVQDDELRMFCHERGVIIKGHHTGGNKWEPSFGVASLSTLLEPLPDGRPTLLLPNDNGSFPAVAALVDQMLTWQPGVRNQVQDCLMSLWFAVIRAREIVRLTPARQVDYVPSEFLGRGRARREQVVVDLEQAAQDHFYATEGF